MHYLDLGFWAFNILIVFIQEYSEYLGGRNGSLILIEIKQINLRIIWNKIILTLLNHVLTVLFRLKRSQKSALTFALIRRILTANVMNPFRLYIPSPLTTLPRSK